MVAWCSPGRLRGSKKCCRLCRTRFHQIQSLAKLPSFEFWRGAGRFTFWSLQQIMLSWEIGALNDLKIAESSLLSLQKTSIIRKHRKPNLLFLYVAKHWQARSAEVSALASNALQQVDRAHQSGMVPSSDGPAQTFATGVGMFTV